MDTDDIDSEEEDLRREEESVQYLKDNFTFADFWDYSQTRTILKNEYLQIFNDGIGKKIINFYLKEYNYNHRKFSSIFAFDTDGTKAGVLESIVFNHIKKEYDIDIFYKNPEWAKMFVQYHLENDTKKKKKTFIIPKKSLRTFNWGTKTYTNST